MAALPVHIRLLGAFALAVNDAPVTVVSPRLQAVLAYLALHREAPLPRRRLAFTLWADTSDAQAQTNLRTVLHRLQASLPFAEQLLAIDLREVGWRAGVALTVDAVAFQDAYGRASSAERAGETETARAELERAAELYAGDLLPERYDEWVLVERERLRGMLLDALERLATLLVGRGEPRLAAQHAQRLARLDPLNEAAHLLLMRTLTASRDHAAALRAYHSFADRLRAEIGVAPGQAMAELYEALLAAQEPAHERPAGALPLVGRRDEWRQALAVWREAQGGAPRLLAISGEAGIGKTRCADELLQWASAHGAAVATAHCYAAEGSLAYAPVAALLRSAELRDGIRRLDAHWLAEVGRLAPELAAGAEVPQPRSLSDAWQRRRLFEALARAVLGREPAGGAAGGRPAVVRPGYPRLAALSCALR